MKRPSHPFRSGAALVLALALSAASRADAQLPPPPPPPPMDGPSDASPPQAEPAPNPGPAVPPATEVAQPPADDAAASEVDAIPPQSRDPFWPVGYVPRRVHAQPKSDRPSAPALIQSATPAPAAGPDWERARAMLVVRGVMGGRGRKYLATVSDQVVETGDEVIVTLAGLTYRWRVLRITPTAIETEQVEVVPARLAP